VVTFGTGPGSYSGSTSNLGSSEVSGSITQLQNVMRDQRARVVGRIWLLFSALDAVDNLGAHAACRLEAGRCRR